MDKLIYGGDTETVHGKPNSLQFYSEDVACDDIFFVNEKTAAKKFIQWCESRKRNIQHVVYIHNLGFDLIEFLWGHHAKLIEEGSEFDFEVHGWRVRGFYGTPTFCSISKGHDRRIVLVDSFSFYRGSLKDAAELYCPDLPKLSKPRGLGAKRFTSANLGFVQYAMRDAEVTYHIGKAIEALHREFDLQQCISIADLAARIFRHRFLTYTIPQPTEDILTASLDSYHGGKNNLTVERGLYVGTTNIDISSAYPDAMQGLPAFSNAALYKPYRVKRGRISGVSSVPEYGVYCVSGRVDQCRWPVLFNHAFKPLSGEFDETWIQGIELNEALRSGEFRPTRIAGHWYDADRDKQAPALRGFCEHFYHLKATEKDKVKRHGWKLIQNSISGKFIQTRKRTLRCYVDIDSGEVSDAAELVAGGMFHPFIASAITAHTRARIHRLEHHYEALHTATDGILTQKHADIRGEFKTVQKAHRLGDLEADTPSPTLIVRNKCYIKYHPDDYKPEKKDKKSVAFKGKYIAKYALHGFQGKVEDLERLVITGERSYTVNRANRLKESIARGLVPNDFQKRTINLNVGKIDVRPRAGRTKPARSDSSRAD